MERMRHRSSRLKIAVRSLLRRHPVTKPDCKVIRRSEENLTEKIDEMVQTALDTIQIIEIDE